MDEQIYKISLAESHPQLAAQWHPHKNGSLTPDRVISRSEERVWWLCPVCKHEWQAKIMIRSRGTGCPACAKIKSNITRKNTWKNKSGTLAEKNPTLAAQWHPYKNGSLTPEQVTPAINRKVWWLGACGHEWESYISNRSYGTGCPYCSGRLLSSKNINLVTTDPEIAAEWHPEKNGNLTPEYVTRGSHREVWWICEKGHEWKAKICSRTYNNNSCPTCAGKQ